MSHIYNADYNNAAATTPTNTTFAPSSAGSPTTTLHSAHLPARGGSPATGYSSTSFGQHTRWKRMRLTVMRMATVERLQLLWGLLALFGSMSWLSLMPAYVFWHRVDPVNFKAPVYSYFLVATVCTSLSAIWQSLCPFLVRQSQRSLLPRVINHPATQTATIIISVALTILNFFSWIILAANKAYGAKTSCLTGTLAKEAGYAAQCRGVNVAIIFDVVVFILWIPISVVIVCGTIDRGLWWWGEDDGWAQGEAIVGGSNMMSEEEFDMKIGMGGKQINRRQTVHPESLQPQDMVMIQQPKPAFVTPIASQFRSSSALGLSGEDDGEEEEDFTNFAPSSYRRHHQRRQQRQPEPRRLTRRGSNTSLSSRLSTFFGTGWNNETMPPENEPPMPQMPSQYRQENTTVSRQEVFNSNNSQKKQQQQQHKQSSLRKTEELKQEAEEESEPAGPLHGNEYASQWHSRRDDDWS